MELFPTKICFMACTTCLDLCKKVLFVSPLRCRRKSYILYGIPLVGFLAVVYGVDHAGIQVLTIWHSRPYGALAIKSLRSDIQVLAAKDLILTVLRPSSPCGQGSNPYSPGLQVLAAKDLNLTVMAFKSLRPRIWSLRSWPSSPCGQGSDPYGPGIQVLVAKDLILMVLAFKSLRPKI